MDGRCKIEYHIFGGKSSNNSIISNHVLYLTSSNEEVDPITHPMPIDLDISEVKKTENLSFK